MTTYANLEVAIPMTWNPDEFWVTFEIREYLGDSYDDGEGTVVYSGECKYGEWGEFGRLVRLLTELRVPFVLRIDEDEGAGTTSSFDGFQRLDAEGYHEIVMSENLYREIIAAKHLWASTVSHYFDVASHFRGDNLDTEHLGALVPPDPRTRRNVLIMDLGPSHPEHV